MWSVVGFPRKFRFQISAEIPSKKNFRFRRKFSDGNFIFPLDFRPTENGNKRKLQTEFRFRYNFHTEDGTKRKLQTEFRLFRRNFRFCIFPFRIFQISVYSVGISVSVYFRFRIFSNFRSFQRNFRFCIFPFPYFFQISVSVTFTEDGKKLFYHNSRNMKNIC